MGFERITAVLQGKESNYDTDVFTPLMDAIGQLTGKSYGGRLDDLDDIAFRVIADHLRMLTFAITDGALPDNKGRGSVLRSVLRRAVRFGWQCFDQREPFIYQLVPAAGRAHGGSVSRVEVQTRARVTKSSGAKRPISCAPIERGLSLYEEAALRAASSRQAR